MTERVRMRWNGKALISSTLIVVGGVLAFVGYAQLLQRPEFGLSQGRVWLESILLAGGMIVWPFWGPPLGLQRISEIPLVLEIARFVLPFGVFSGAGLLLARVFGARIRMFRARFARDHIVVCAGGPAAWQFVTDLQRHPGSKVVVLDLNATHANADEERAVPILPAAGEIDEALLLRAAIPSARAIVALGTDDMQGVEVLLQAKSIAARHRPASAAPLSGRAMISSGNAEDAAEALFGAHDRSFAFRPISVARNTVRLLLRAQPLDCDAAIRAGGRLHVRIVGFDSVGQELALEVARSGHFADARLPLVSIIDPQASRLYAALAERRPELALAAEFRIVTADIENLSVWDDDSEMPYSRTAVCLTDEMLGLRTAAALAHRAATAATAVPLFVQLAKASVAAEALRVTGPHGPAIIPFGDMASLFTREIVLEETLDTLARQVHAYYRENRAAGAPVADETLPAERPWDDLPESFREASRHQADHMLAKLRAIRCDAVPGPIAGTFAFSSDEVEQLSRIEHRRWNAERRVAGWRYASSRRDEAREHPSLVTWEDLSESEREKDREAVRTIPAILARAGLAIRRQPEAR